MRKYEHRWRSSLHPYWTSENVQWSGSTFCLIFCLLTLGKGLHVTPWSRLLELGRKNSVAPIFNNIKHKKKLYNTRDKYFIYSQNYVASIIGCASGSDRDIHGIILTHKRCAEDPIGLLI